MAAFRKCFFAFAVLALLSSLAVPASAQIQQALTCTANAGVPPTVRAEALADQVGDLVINCTGGTPTAVGQVLPLVNVSIFLSTNITSRLTASDNTSEALLFIDEPHSTTNPLTPLNKCVANGSGINTCNIVKPAAGSPYAGTGVLYNSFQGRQTAVNQVTFFGVPFDAPGTLGTRVIRITNIRGNASQLGVSSTLVPTQITAYISISGTTSISLNNPQQTVAYVQQGLTVGTGNTTYTFIQCNSANPALATDPSKTLGDPSKGQHGTQWSIKFTEGFGTAWKVRNVSESLNPSDVATLAGTNTSFWAQGADNNQNVPGWIYNTETGFLNRAASADPTPNPPPTQGPYNGTPLVAGSLPTDWGFSIGGATQGTRLMASFASIPNGTVLYVPTVVFLTNTLTGNVSGRMQLVSTDANGAGAFAAVSATDASDGVAGKWLGLSPVSISNNAGIAVYEIVVTDPYALEQAVVPVAVAYVANVGNNLPQPGVTSTVQGSFAPLSNVGTASMTAPIPRFVPSTAAKNTFNVVKCSCNILFPFVTNQQGYDTGIAISNTSLDTLNGVAPQSGIVTLAYFGGSTPPPNQVTNAVVPGGAQVLFTLSGGGNYGLAATPGFQGYIIAQAQFQYCHAFAYISAQGALPTAPGASESYLGIILDAPGIWRTGQFGENSAH